MSSQPSALTSLLEKLSPRHASQAIKASRDYMDLFGMQDPLGASPRTPSTAEHRAMLSGKSPKVFPYKRPIYNRQTEGKRPAEEMMPANPPLPSQSHQEAPQSSLPSSSPTYTHETDGEHPSADRGEEVQSPNPLPPSQSHHEAHQSSSNPISSRGSEGEHPSADRDEEMLPPNLPPSSQSSLAPPATYGSISNFGHRISRSRHHAPSRYFYGGSRLANPPCTAIAPDNVPRAPAPPTDTGILPEDTTMRDPATPPPTLATDFGAESFRRPPDGTLKHGNPASDGSSMADSDDEEAVHSLVTDRPGAPQEHAAMDEVESPSTTASSSNVRIIQAPRTPESQGRSVITPACAPVYSQGTRDASERMQLDDMTQQSEQIQPDRVFNMADSRHPRCQNCHPSRAPPPTLGNLESLVQQAVTNSLGGFKPIIIETIKTSVAENFSAATSTPDRRSSKKASSSPMDGDDEDDDDDDDDYLERVTRKPRKSSSPRGESNFWHDAFCQYLREKNVIPGQKEDLPPSIAPLDTVRCFDLNHTGGPHDLLLEQGSHFPAYTRLRISTQGRRPQKAYKDHTSLSALAESPTKEAAKKLFTGTKKAQRDKDRRYHRKRGTLDRRRRIIQENKNRNPQLWSQIGAIVARLDVDGMSGDETDSPPGQPKQTRRTALNWRSAELSEMFDAVESYEGAFRAESMKTAKGNQRFARKYASVNVEVGKPVLGLPRNWYSDQWVQSLPCATQKMLGLDSEILLPIPNLTHYEFNMEDHN
ncbi:hypothetical protein BJ138DRAFT_1117447 [Hygrophoropsis aurantiaca]|uniref:Uncharacterized protein n=1 Tax=Hygrophoropsis aurantiaca TaxID=72124 RepID=A0ACB8A0Q3_9AGAM|nr:hypothetical protein BJ138DRAFT_1117447 [Hygrophoropsis aurantiaca]